MLWFIRRCGEWKLKAIGMFSQLTWLLLSLTMFLAWRFMKFIGQTDKIHGVYSQPTIFYWPKYFLIKFLISRQQRKRQANKLTFNGDLFHMNRKDRTKMYDKECMERKQNLPRELSFAGDCIFFNGANSNGCYLAFGFAQRQKNTANVFFVLKIPGLGTLVNEELLKSSNIKTISDNEIYKSESGFQVKCLKPMENWHLQFDGNLVEASELHQDLKTVGEDQPNENAKRFHCKFDWIWESTGDYFLFDTDVSSELIAHSLALETWNLQMFKKLDSSHQIHYEQFGKLSGDLAIDNQKHDFKITSMRDHTIAPYRRWTDMRRYIMIVFHLEDGTCINSMAVSMPEVVFSHLQFGYVIKPDGKKLPINKLNLQLPFLGENKHFPDQFEYDFEIEQSSKWMTVQVKVRERVAFKMGLDSGCYIEELMCDFNVCGQRGYGFCEVEYRIQPY